MDWHMSPPHGASPFPSSNPGNAFPLDLAEEVFLRPRQAVTFQSSLQILSLLVLEMKKCSTFVEGFYTTWPFIDTG